MDSSSLQLFGDWFAESLGKLSCLFVFDAVLPSFHLLIHLILQCWSNNATKLNNITTSIANSFQLPRHRRLTQSF